MADLPLSRVNPGQNPFFTTGCDVFGHFYVKQGRSRVKRWVVLYSCHSSRAIHLELIHHLDIASFINAFRRFSARRGHVDKMVVDNATNNRGSDRELSESIAAWNHSEIGRQLRRHSTTFIYNTPKSSHAGGVFERAIRSVREHLRHVVGDQSLTEENLLTYIVEAEFLVNSRPLTPTSDEPDDVSALSPNDLLILKPMDPLPPGIFTVDQAQHVRKGWKQVQALANCFWRRWTNEYLPTLSKRTKWTQPHRNLRVGDLVLVQDEMTTRGHWPLARITQTFASSGDRLVRSAEVKMKSGRLFRRPVSKLFLLEASDL